MKTPIQKGEHHTSIQVSVSDLGHMKKHKMLTFIDRNCTDKRLIRKFKRDLDKASVNSEAYIWTTMHQKVSVHGYLIKDIKGELRTESQSYINSARITQFCNKVILE